MTNKARYRRAVPSILFALLIGFIAYALSDNRFVLLLEEQLEDFCYSIHSQTRIEERIVVIEIDDKTLDYYCPDIPLPRHQMMLLLEELLGPKGAARTVVLDLYFDGPDEHDPWSDTALASTFVCHGDRIVNAMYLPLVSEEYLVCDTTGRDCLRRFSYPTYGFDIPSVGESNLPLGMFLCSSQYYGHVDVFYGQSEIIRELPLFVYTGSSVIGALSLEAVRNYLRINTRELICEDGKLLLGSHRVPLNRDGSLDIRYFRNSLGYSRYSMMDVLDSFEKGSTQENLFGDKLVIIGVNSKRYYPKEISFTPSGQARASVYLHADIISNIMSDCYYRKASRTVILFLVLLTCVCWVVIELIAATMFRIIVSALAVVTYLLTGYLLFQNGVILEVAPLVLLSSSLSIYTSARAFSGQHKTITERRDELKAARQVQEFILPKNNPQIDKYNICGVNIPAKEVSGDFYDFISLPEGRLAITIGDVCGKGLPAAILMSATQAIIRSECLKRSPSDLSCSELVASVNMSLGALLDESKFVTLFLCVLDTRSDRVSYVNAGHDFPVLIDQRECVIRLDQGGGTLGPFPEQSYSSDEFMVHPGQKLLLYTDGITEAANPTGDMYGEERLIRLFLEKQGLSAGEIAQAIIADVSRFAKGVAQADDTTLVVISRYDK